MHGLSQQFLSLRALGAPAVVVSLAVQGVFRGFKDTRTPLFSVGKFAFHIELLYWMCVKHKIALFIILLFLVIANFDGHVEKT